MVSDVTTTGLIQSASATQSQGIQLSQDLDDFLNLLTVQLQNQDPLNPTDTDKLTDQITQFSQVEQQINTNQKLDDMLALQLSSLYSVGLGFVGLDASYVGAEFNFDGNTPVDVTFALSDAAKGNKINIYNEAGDLVDTIDGPTEAGRHTVTWDGVVGQGDGTLADSGTYTVSVDAFDFNDEPLQTTTVVTGRVRGIESQNGVIYLLVGDRAVSISNIISAAQPEAEEPAQVPDVPDDGESDA